MKMKLNLWVGRCFRTGLAVVGAASLVGASRAALVDTWDAFSLTNTVAPGGLVTNWVSVSNRTATLVSGLTAPTLIASPSGAPVLHFDGGNRLVLPGASSPVGGRTAFSVAIVFKANAAGANDNAQWWGKTGIVDAEQPGATADWGTSIGSGGNFLGGIGNGDNSLASNVGSLVDSRYHIAVFTWGGGTTRLFIDNFAPVQATGVPTAARNAANISFGGIQTGEANRRLQGDIGQVDFYDTALTQQEATNVVNALAAKFGIVFPQLINSFTISTNLVSAGQSVTLNWSVASNATITIQPSPGTLTNVTGLTTNGVGSIAFTPTNDTSYTLTSSNSSGVRFLTVSVVVNRTAATSLIDVWDPAVLSGVGSGNAIPNWISQSNRTLTNISGAPIFVAGATPAGTPVVRFNNTIMRTTSADSPVGGLSEFTVAYVFKVSTPPSVNGNAQWWGQTCIVDAEQPGATADWGTAVNLSGQVGLGIGNPDVTVYSSGSSVVDPLYHVAVFTWGQGRITTWLDNRAPVVNTNASTGARNVSPVAFGGSQVVANPFGGDLAEVRFYNDALTPTEVSNVLGSLIAKHGVFFPAVVSTFTASPTTIDAGQSTILSWQADPGVTLTIDQGIGNVDANTTNGVGNISVTPANDTTYTLTGTDTNGITRTRTATVIVNRTLAASQVDIWDAVDLGFSYIDGDPVTTWTSQNARNATTSTATSPTYHENATPSGTPTVRFTNSLLRVAGIDNPVKTLTEFAVAYVFKLNAQPYANDSALWWGKTGVVDAEEPNSMNDWGTALDENARLGFGVGPSDTTVYGSNSLFDGQYHVAVATWGSGVQRLFVDNQPPVTTTTNVAGGARDAADVVFGGITSGQTNRLFVGEIAEIRFYNDALPTNEIASLITTLALKHAAGGVLAARVLPLTFNLSQQPVIRWTATVGASYTVRRKTDLNGGWTILDTRTATQSIETFTDTTAPAGQAFYQVTTP